MFLETMHFDLTSLIALNLSEQEPIRSDGALAQRHAVLVASHLRARRRIQRDEFFQQ